VLAPVPTDERRRVLKEPAVESEPQLVLVQSKLVKSCKPEDAPLLNVRKPALLPFMKMPLTLLSDNIPTLAPAAAGAPNVAICAL
jgi:hypothetical protein